MILNCVLVLFLALISLDHEQIYLLYYRSYKVCFRIKFLINSNPKFEH